MVFTGFNSENRNTMAWINHVKINININKNKHEQDLIYSKAVKQMTSYCLGVRVGTLHRKIHKICFGQVLSC